MNNKYSYYTHILLFLVLALPLILSGCAQTTPTASPVETAETNPIRAYAGRTLRIALEDNDATTTIKQLISDFEQETGISVILEIFDETTLRQKLVLDFTSHTNTYDIGELQYWYVPEFAAAGYLVSLDDLMAEGTVPDWLDVNDFPGRTIDAMKYKGTLYGLPVRLIGGMHYYRKDLLEENGWSVPKTTSDVLDLAKKTKEVYGDKVFGWSERGNRESSSFGSFAGWASAYGAKLLDDNYHPTLLTDPAWKAAITDWVTLMKDYCAPGAANMSWYDAYQLFQAGSAIQMFETSDYGAVFEDPSESKVSGKVGYAEAPTGSAGKTAQWFFVSGYSINKDISPEQQAAAWLFLQWRSSAKVFAKEMTVPTAPRFTVPSTNVLNSPEFDQAAAEQNLTEYAKGMRSVFASMDPWYWPFVPEYIKIGEAFATNVSSAIAGQITVDEVLQKSNTEIEQILSEAGYYK